MTAIREHQSILGDSMPSIICGTAASRMKMKKSSIKTENRGMNVEDIHDDETKKITLSKA